VAPASAATAAQQAVLASARAAAASTPQADTSRPVASSAPAPATPPPAPARPVVATDDPTTVFATIDTALAERRWADVLATLAAVRSARPAWQATRSTDLLRREIAARRGLGETLEMLAAVRSLLDGSNPRGLEMMTLVRELDEAGDRATARQVLDEVLRRNPAFPPALRQLKAWAAPAGGEPARP
jgi:hypothetical protein